MGENIGSTLWFNVTSSVAWTRPPVGIIKVERSICADLEALYGASALRKCVWRDGAFHAWEDGKVSGLADFAPGDVFITMGLDWDYPYAETFRSLARRRGVEILSFCYDLVPILFPQYCVAGVPDKFKTHLKTLAFNASALLCISRQTQKDFIAHAKQMGYPVPPTHVVTLGDEVPSRQGEADAEIARLLSEPYILFVSTIERRKNHEVLYRAYHELVRRGHGAVLPKLLFIGMSGWGVGDLLKDIELDPSVRGRIVMINRVSDRDLRTLYEKALFCAYPSLYEGWGLPIGEALSLGKAVLSSDRGSLPEVGGDLVRYLDPWSPPAWADAILDWVSHPQKVEQVEKKVAAAYVPRDWKSAALAVKTVADGHLGRGAAGSSRTGWPILARLLKSPRDGSQGESETMAEFDTSRPLAFFHVPKTGGYALNSAFRQALGDAKAVAGDQDRSLFGRYDDFASWHPDHAKRMILSPDQIAPDAKYISGHFALSTILAGLPDAQLVTLLREPMSRLLSHWIYWRKLCESGLGVFGSWGESLRLALAPLHDFIRIPAIACQTDNVAVRMLLWPHALIPDDDFIAPEHDDELVSLALDALDRFAFVGIYEDKGSTAAIEAFLGRPLPIKKENETASLSPDLSTRLFAELDEPTLGLLQDRCRLDIKVWSAWAARKGLDPDQLFFGTVLKNVSRFSLLLSGAAGDPRETRQLKQQVQMLEQSLSTAQQVNDMLVQQLSQGFMKP